MGIRVSRGDSQGGDKEEPTAPRLNFPQGLNALFTDGPDGKRIPMKDTDKVTLVNCSLTTVYVRDRDYSTAPADGKFHETTIQMFPGAAHEMSVLYAKRALAVQARAGEVGFELVVAPPPGDCQGKWKFQAFGKPWKTCPYGECKTHGPLPPNVHWSLWQAQHRIGRLGSEEAIDLWIEKMDSRPEVMMWGLRHVKDRSDRRRENMGLTPPRNDEDTVN